MSIAKKVNAKLLTGRQEANQAIIHSSVLIQPFQEQCFTACCIEWETTGHQSYANQNQKRTASWKVYCVAECLCSLKSAFFLHDSARPSRWLTRWLSNALTLQNEKWRFLEWQSLDDAWNGTDLNFNHVSPGRKHNPSRIFPLMIHKLNVILKKHWASMTFCRISSMSCKVSFTKAQDKHRGWCQLKEHKETKSQSASSFPEWDALAAASLPEWDALGSTEQMWKHE